ncbi:putative non-reducing end alpha-L-arabinofuranosidase [Helianthus annuus]|nr:putative non-reducing end alpha-L-arabinofuranosidase [Helianthus annuus]KAJ0502832.1 putative non-reducing end alpha-L-arabinofuranosidase [Helianthus annuus]KAJ0503987.1 putative non-reducing end alpha-L-arabinofuranosidase [Helianthus annuus]KAJ0518791.1 putative non-reducing end alpha-L-arabinofuranosidase [Helianthus annuus]KAJ0655946.1 putative non-reducing end alpha-L-arabinofuranosidase [Helianthus annuus]
MLYTLGGSFAEGKSLLNAYWWKDTVGPWEERPGHMNDVWAYWTDDGLGYFEFLQLAEDLNATPIWVFNSAIQYFWWRYPWAFNCCELKTKSYVWEDG